MCTKGCRTTGKVTHSSFSEGSSELSAALMLDSLGERYGMLPSEVLSRGSALDLWVFDIAVSYRSYKQAEKSGDKEALSQFYKTEDLQEQLNKVRNG